MGQPLIKRAWDISSKDFPPLRDAHHIASLLQPESDLEWQLLDMPAFRDGLLWGEPRFGHPEGKIAYHVREVLDNIDRLEVAADVRSRLRLLAWVHDTFKPLEDTNRPRDWSRHHGMLARRFFEPLTSDQPLLDILELHDEAFYAWRLLHISHNYAAGEKRLQRLFDRLDDQLPLYALFYRCDTETGNKIQNPLHWFESLLEA